MALNANIPEGALHEKWEHYLQHAKRVSPANKQHLDIIVVGTGLAGASAAASLAEQGYKVTVLCVQDTPRRAHSIAAQGGINAAKNYPNDGDSIWNLFYDTIKGGDFRSREANVYRLAQISNAISMLIGKNLADSAFDSAACIGCGACVAACPNASASLFTGAKISQLALLPQGQPERGQRARSMVEQMDIEGFGNCSNLGECEAVCPKEISLDNIATMKREYLRAMVGKN